MKPLERGVSAPTRNIWTMGLQLERNCDQLAQSRRREPQSPHRVRLLAYLSPSRTPKHTEEFGGIPTYNVSSRSVIIAKNLQAH